MQERNGVRAGQPVRDLDGTSLGRVVRLFAEGFLVRRGRYGRDYVLRYDEVRAVERGVLVVARSSHDLFELARGGLPPAWDSDHP